MVRPIPPEGVEYPPDRGVWEGEAGFVERFQRLRGDGCEGSFF